MLSRKRKSPVWDHFTKTSKDMAKCNYCPSPKGDISNKSGVTTNMKNHLRSHHVSIFLNMQNAAAAGDTDNSRDNEESVDEDGLLADVDVRSPTPSPGPGRGLSPSPSTSAGDNNATTNVSGQGQGGSSAFSPPPSPAVPKR